jgi:hypothetical protein
VTALVRARALLERAEEIVSDETGMVVCWHEFTAAQTLRSHCVQCCVEHALQAVRELGRRTPVSGSGRVPDAAPDNTMPGSLTADPGDECGCGDC